MEGMRPTPVPLVHVTTVPMTLRCLSGQPEFMRRVYREGFPMVPLEAASMRLPVVATRVPGCTDAVQDGVTGTLVPPRDSRSLAGALRTYLRSPHLRRVHGDAARAHVIREFRQERFWGAMAVEYRSLLMMSPLSSPQPVDGGATAGSGS